MKIGVIKSLAGQHGVRKLCRTLGVARRACCAAEQKAARPVPVRTGLWEGR